MNTLIDEVTEKMVQGMKPYNDKEKELLTNHVKKKVKKIIQIDQSALPGEIAEMFSNEPGENPVPLIEFCTAKEGVLNDRAVNILSTLARWFDFLAGNRRPLFCILPECFKITAEGRLFVNKPIFEQCHPDEHGCINRAFIQNNRSRIHKDLVRKPEAILKAPGYYNRYTFIRVLAEILANVKKNTLAEVIGELKRCRHKQPALSPMLPDFLIEMLEAVSNDETLPDTCEGSLEKALHIVRKNPLVCNAHTELTQTHEMFAYTVTGVNKSGNDHEDCFFWSKVDSFSSLLLVADGVSTASIGSGYLAANNLRRSCELIYLDQFKQLAEETAKKINSGNQGVTPESWMHSAENLFSALADDANQRITDDMNILTQDGIPSEKDRQYPMCSTLTAAFVMGDQALLTSAGDSPALLYSPSRDIFSVLTVEDTVNSRKEFSLQETSGGEALMRVIGAAAYDEKTRRFVAESAKLTFYRVQLQPGDLLIIASDGIINGIQSSIQEERPAFLKKTVKKKCGEGSSLKEIVRAIVNLAEKGLSNDNITAAALLLKERK
ncbi:PP2C family protein-serine/threonine phosphatase [Desulfobacter latus]|uniref:Protein phosphatase 2C domain-containing protein n=1 Tax=Desulfobacter latus TaxID=2292 RepID=A0A850T4V0_9BACT|nr:protein phosphatase 2C domain-containing protein [Desulfobacter latus]NWH03885.1 protein phosphatase 2C domain-containing protein [Desulfobacter latus]